MKTIQNVHYIRPWWYWQTTPYFDSAWRRR